MDVAEGARQILLDQLCTRACTALAASDIPHAVLKGPSTARWLYDPPRAYRDVDLLVPESQLEAAVRALEAAGVATASTGRFGEAAAHSLVMLDPRGFELDLHVSLPMLAPRKDDTFWEALSFTTLNLDGHQVPVLDIPGRCLVLCLHALAAYDQRVREDLVRALAAASDEEWARARELAVTLGIEDVLDDGLAVVEPSRSMRTVDGRLKEAGAVGSAFGLQRVTLEHGVTGKMRALWREAFPSAAFMRRADPGPLPRAYARRLRRLAAEMPAAVAQWRQARKIR